MNFITERLNLFAVLFLLGFAAMAAGMYFDFSLHPANAVVAASVNDSFTCPMHREVVSAKAGDCPKCGMALVAVSSLAAKPADGDACAEEMPHGCCAKPTGDELTLPPGHPPIPGYTIQSGCPHSAGNTNSTAQ